ncbi:hypothetical protein ACFLQ5_02300 [Bacteroidota bacterium]
MQVFLYSGEGIKSYDLLYCQAYLGNAGQSDHPRPELSKLCIHHINNTLDWSTKISFLWSISLAFPRGLLSLIGENSLNGVDFIY